MGDEDSKLIERWKKRIVEIRDVTDEFDKRFLDKDERVFLVKYRMWDGSFDYVHVIVRKGYRISSHPLALAVKEIVESDELEKYSHPTGG